MAGTATDKAAKSRVDHEALLRKLHPARLVERDGQVVGAWLVTATHVRPQGASAGKGPLSFDADVQGFVRTPDGVAGVRARVPLDGRLRESVEAALHGLGATDDPGLRARSDADFATAMRAAAVLAGSAGDVAASTSVEALADGIARTLDGVLGDALDDDELDRLARERAGVMAARIGQAVAAFDPDAVDLLLEHEGHGPALSSAWGGIDRNLDAEAPLALALDGAPDRAGEFLAAWDADPDAFTPPLRDGDWEGMLARMAVARGEIPAGKAGMFGAAVRAMARIKPDSRAAAFSGVVGRDARTDACRVLSLVDGHDLGDVPDMRAWSSLVRLVPALSAARDWAGDGAGVLLPLDRGAAATLERLRTASGKDTVADAVAKIGDMASAFAREVLRPAAGLAGRLDRLPPPADGRWVTAAADILWSGKPMATMVADAQAWAGSARDASPEADMPAEVTPEWQAALPSVTRDRGTVSVVASMAELRALSAPAPLGIGVDLTGHGRDCAAGTRRVAVVTQEMPDGTREVLSCHLLAIHGDRVEPVGVLGRAGEDADVACVKTVSRYAETVSRDPGVDLPGILVSGAAFDASRRQRAILAEGAWAAAKASWSRHLGPGFSARLLADMLATHVAEGRPAWSAGRIDADDRKAARAAFQPVTHPDAVETETLLKVEPKPAGATAKSTPQRRAGATPARARDVPMRARAAPASDWPSPRYWPVPATARPRQPQPQPQPASQPRQGLSKAEKRALRVQRRTDMFVKVAEQGRAEQVGPSPTKPVLAKLYGRPASGFGIVANRMPKPIPVSPDTSEPVIVVPTM